MRKYELMTIFPLDEEKSKKELKKILKKKGINPDNLTKEEMLDMIDTFC